MRRSVRLMEKKKSGDGGRDPPIVGRTEDGKSKPIKSKPKSKSTTRKKALVTGINHDNDQSNIMNDKRSLSLALHPQSSTTVNFADNAKKRQRRITAIQRTLNEGKTFLAPLPLNAMCIDHVAELVFSNIFPGPPEENFRLADICNFRLVCRAWNRAGVRLLKRHCQVVVGNTWNSSGPEALLPKLKKENRAPAVKQPTVNVRVEKIGKYITIMKKSADTPFVMYTLKETLFLAENSRSFVELVQVFGPTMEQLCVIMEPSTCTFSFLIPRSNLNKLKILKVTMKRFHSDVVPPARFSIREIFSIDGMNGMYLLQNLCNGAVNLDELEIHWLTTPYPYSSFGLKDIYLPKTVTKLTLESPVANVAALRNVCFENELWLSTLKLSLKLPLQTLTSSDLSLCLKRHSKTLETLYISIWDVGCDKDGPKLFELPTMPNVKQLTIMGDAVKICTFFSFPKILPRLTSLIIDQKMLVSLAEAVPSNTVKVVRILGVVIPYDATKVIARVFPELQTLVYFPRRSLHKVSYVVALFEMMPKLKILRIPISKEHGNAKLSNYSRKALPEEMRVEYDPKSIFIWRVHVDLEEKNPPFAQALNHLQTMNKTYLFTADEKSFHHS